MTEYTTRYLKFADEQTATAQLVAAFGVAEDGGPIVSGTHFYVDVVGVLDNQDGTYDAEGNTPTPPTLIEGWHVNLAWPAGEQTPEPLMDYELPAAPTNPRRVFAC